MTELDAAALSPKQRLSIRDARARWNIWHGSVRSGKTLASEIAWLHYLATDCPRVGMPFMIGRTRDTLYRNVIAPIQTDLLGTDPGAFKYTQGATSAVVFGREVAIIGANDVGAESRIRGATIPGAYVDEASLLPGHGFWQQLGNRMSPPGARGFATTNPDNPSHWLKAEVIDRADELGYAVWHFLLDDNPSLTPEFKASIELENVGLWYQRNVRGLWVLAEGVIYDGWDADRIVSEDRPDIRDWVVAVDYGTAGVFAALLIGHGADGRLWVVDEWRHDARKAQRQLTDVEYSKALRDWLADLDPMSNAVESKAPGARTPSRIVVDPSATSFITQLHKDANALGEQWRPRLADNAVADGIRWTSSLMRGDRLRVDPSCTGLLAEVPGYVWDPKAALLGEDKPVKRDDHSCDALRYGVMGTRRWWRHWLQEQPTG